MPPRHMLASLRSLLRPSPQRLLVAELYRRIGTAAREPALYQDLGIPDTLEGRFESLSLHMVLALRALRGRGAAADALAADLTDAFFRDLDGSLREMGVGDTRVPKRMKSLAAAFYGRAGAYDSALDSGDFPRLAEALGRNVIGAKSPAEPLARYALAADRQARAASIEDHLRDGPAYPTPTGFAAPPAAERVTG